MKSWIRCRMRLMSFAWILISKIPKKRKKRVLRCILSLKKPVQRRELNKRKRKQRSFRSKSWQKRDMLIYHVNNKKKRSKGKRMENNPKRRYRSQPRILMLRSLNLDGRASGSQMSHSGIVPGSVI
jgi:hypothetical protein